MEITVKSKPKYNKKKCAKCKYHGVGMGGYTVKIGDRQTPIYCNYTSINAKSCLEPLKDGGTVDIRGGDFNNCLLYEKGKALKEKKKTTI